MSVLNQLNTRLNEEWSALTKHFWKYGSDAASETAGAAAEALKTLAKEITHLGERLERWVASTRKTPASEDSTRSDATASAASSSAVTPPPPPTEAGATIAHGGPGLATAVKQAAESNSAKAATPVAKATSPGASADKSGASADKSGASADKSGASADKSGASADKSGASADKSGASADKSGASADKSGATPKKK